MASGDRGPPVVLVAEDERDFRFFLRTLLEEAGYRVRECSGGEEALTLIRNEAPDLVVADVSMPSFSGYELCRRLHDDVTAPPIMLLSGSHVEVCDRAAGLELGADDYILKPFAPEEFLARVRAVLRRSHGHSRSTTPVVRTLTPREQEVLNLIAEGVEQAEIASRLGIAPRTVGKHVERILAKLGVHTRAAAVAVAYRAGLESPVRDGN